MVTPGTLKELLKSKVPVFTPPDPPKYIGGWLLDVDMMFSVSVSTSSFAGVCQ
jgi:hypothetical protein